MGLPDWQLNQGLSNLVSSMGSSNETPTNDSTLVHLNLGNNNINGAEGGRQVGLLLQRCFRLLKVLITNH